MAEVMVVLTACERRGRGVGEAWERRGVAAVVVLVHESGVGD